MSRFPTRILAVALIVAACGGSDGSYGSGPGGGTTAGTTGSTSNSITVSDNKFTPAATTVTPGTTVTWTWAQGATTHNVTFDDGTKSASQSTGTYARTFGAAGSYAYQCTIHPGMSGSVTVK